MIMIDERTGVQSNPPVMTNQHKVIPGSPHTWTMAFPSIGIFGTTDEVIRELELRMRLAGTRNGKESGNNDDPARRQHHQD